MVVGLPFSITVVVLLVTWVVLEALSSLSKVE